jgi:hypothetical protein
MKHSAKAVAKLAREREKLARHTDAATAAGPAGSADAIALAATAGSAGAATAAGPAGGAVAAAKDAGRTISGRTISGRAGSSSQAMDTGMPMARPAGSVDAQRADGVAAVVATGVTAVSDRRRAGYLLAQLPYLLVLAGVLLGLVLMRGGAQAVRGGTLVIASALLAGSLTRLLLPDGMAGLLGSRRRLVDVGLLTALGVGLLIAGLIVKVPS